MDVVILTPIRLLGDGLARWLVGKPEIVVVTVAADLLSLRQTLSASNVDTVLVDVTQALDFLEIRAVATEWPRLTLIALGLPERHSNVVRCGRAGFRGYVARDKTIDELYVAMLDAVGGRLPCPAEISSRLFRALFDADVEPADPAYDPSLTRRQCDVLRLIGQGLTNKEIAHQLSLSTATVKHHVHHVLTKLHVQRRSDAMRRVRHAPWMAALPPV